MRDYILKLLCVAVVFLTALAIAVAVIPRNTEFVLQENVVIRDRYVHIEHCTDCKPTRSARIACADCCTGTLGGIGEDKTALHFETLTCAESCVRAVEGLCEDAEWVKNECPRLVEGY